MNKNRLKKKDFNIENIKIIKKTIKKIQKKLENEDIYTFKKEPSVYYMGFKNLFYLKICDEGEKSYSINKEKKSTVTKNTVFNLYLKKEILEDDTWAESVYLADEFIESIVGHRERNISVVDAYTQNLKRIDALVKDNHYYASIILIVSAFENAVKKLIFDNSEIWFFTLEGGFDLDLANKYGISGEKPNNRIIVHAGEVIYSFNDEDYKKYKSFVNIKNKVIVYQIIKKLGLFNRYFERLSCNSFKEIGFYEILKHLLEEEYLNSRLNFQKINGEGGVRWVMKNFFSIDLTPIDKQLKYLEDIFLLRHRVVHGFVDDNQIDFDKIKKGKENLRKVLLFLDHEINSWYSVIP